MLVSISWEIKGQLLKIVFLNFNVRIGIRKWTNKMGQREHVTTQNVITTAADPPIVSKLYSKKDFSFQKATQMVRSMKDSTKELISGTCVHNI